MSKNKSTIHEVAIQELRDQLTVERVRIDQMKALFREIITYDQGRAYINQLPTELVEKITKCIKS